jgi:Restriction endonuclease BsobI
MHLRLGETIMTGAGHPVGNKNSGQPYQTHLITKADLITSHAETRSGFLELALEKNRQATPFIIEARALKAVAFPLARPVDLLTLTTIQSALVTAAGISDKAASHLDITTKEQAVRDFITSFLDTAGTDWVDELIYRFLITRGRGWFNAEHRWSYCTAKANSQYHCRVVVGKRLL